jgi:hypothetical protein
MLRLATIIESNSFPSLDKISISFVNDGFISCIISKKKIDSSNSSSTIFNLLIKFAFDLALKAAL